MPDLGHDQTCGGVLLKFQPFPYNCNHLRINKRILRRTVKFSFKEVRVRFRIGKKTKHIDNDSCT